MKPLSALARVVGRALRRGVSVRAKVLGILAGGAVFTALAAGVLVVVVRQSDDYLERTSAIHRQLELLFVLSGRISDYRLVAQETSQSQPPQGQRLQQALDQIDAVFRQLDANISRQVVLAPDDDARSAAATKGLQVARMSAQLKVLNDQLMEIVAGGGPAPDRLNRTQGTMNAFGVRVSPQLARAVELERAELRAINLSMNDLRRDATVFAVVWMVLALSTAGLLYGFAGRAMFVRIRQTIAGASEISSGKPHARLEPSGHDELTLLMMRFNRMADSFARREARLIAMRDDLQKTIAARTKDLRAANQRLAQIDADRRRFFSEISHELRTPLTVIAGEADVSLRQRPGLEDAGTRKSLEVIAARTKALKRRVDDLLRVARSESGMLDLDRAKANLDAVIRQAMDDAGPVLRAHKVEIAAHLGTERITCHCDQDWLRQAIAGVLVNAAKYSPPDSQVTISLGVHSHKAVIAIEDEGFGIPEADLAKVFDRFYKGRGRGDGKRAGGFGIGLSLVKWVIEAHDGVIEVESPMNAGRADHPGSRFTITLPLGPLGTLST